VTRVHGSWLASGERWLLVWLAERMPRAVSSDLLTGLGFAGAVLTGLGFVLSWLSSWLLLFACLGLLLNWFGDSLDGTLARVRGMERKRYGFFIDHGTDVAGQVFVFVGLGLSPLMRLDTACLLLISYWLATLLTLIRAVATGVFRISYYGVGPTEIRIAVLLYTLAAFLFGPLAVLMPIGMISLIDLASVPIFLGVFCLYLVMITVESRRLAAEDTADAASAPRRNP